MVKPDPGNDVYFQARGPTQTLRAIGTGKVRFTFPGLVCMAACCKTRHAEVSCLTLLPHLPSFQDKLAYSMR